MPFRRSKRMGRVHGVAIRPKRFKDLYLYSSVRNAPWNDRGLFGYGIQSPVLGNQDENLLWLVHSRQPRHRLVHTQVVVKTISGPAHRGAFRF